MPFQNASSYTWRNAFDPLSYPPDMLSKTCER